MYYNDIEIMRMIFGGIVVGLLMYFMYVKGYDKATNDIVGDENVTDEEVIEWRKNVAAQYITDVAYMLGLSTEEEVKKVFTSVITPRGETSINALIGEFSFSTIVDWNLSTVAVKTYDYKRYKTKQLVMAFDEKIDTVRVGKFLTKQLDKHFKGMQIPVEEIEDEDEN